MKLCLLTAAGFADAVAPGFKYSRAPQMLGFMAVPPEGALIIFNARRAPHGRVARALPERRNLCYPGKGADRGCGNTSNNTQEEKKNANLLFVFLFE